LERIFDPAEALRATYFVAMVAWLTQSGRRSCLLWSVSLSGALALLACGRSHGARPTPPPANAGGAEASGSAGAAASSGGPFGEAAAGGDGGNGGVNGGGGEGGSSMPECGAAAPGVVRLSFAQVKNSLSALFGPEAAQEITGDLAISDQERLLVPALSDPSEGSVVAGTVFLDLDRVAQAAGAYVFAHLDAVTGCGADASEECARAFLGEFTERAFRRPPTDVERDNVLQVFDEARSDEIGASVAEAVQYGVYAVFESPLFVYRTELGAPGDAALPLALTPHELASALSYFLTGAPPDAALLDAARDGALSTTTELAPHVDRLLASAPGRAWLAATAFGHFRLSRIEQAVLDPQVFPGWSTQLRSAMDSEARAFLARTLFDQPLAALLTSRQSSLNAELASLYGVAFPPPGVPVAADGFAEVELPAERAGLLTLGSALVAQSRPDAASPEVRSLWVSRELLCQQFPPLPDDIEALSNAKAEAALLLEGASEREAAIYRMESSECAHCHTLFDPYGVALAEFDGLGAYRPVDANGQTIDPSVTLPDALGGSDVAGAAELGAVLGASDAFTACVAKSFLLSAMPEARGDVEQIACSASDVVAAYRSGADDSFAGLVRAIALSRALRERGTIAP
jgi:hypothetical protein